MSAKQLSIPELLVVSRVIAVVGLSANPNRYYNLNEHTRHIHELAQHILDFPNQRGIHAGGILISEEPITQYVALDMPPKGFLTTQWDMYVSEELGYEKLDILSQRGIGHIKEAADLVRENRGITVDIHDVQRFKSDPKVQQQIEHRQQRSALRCSPRGSPSPPQKRLDQLSRSRAGS